MAWLSAGRTTDRPDAEECTNVLEYAEVALLNLDAEDELLDRLAVCVEAMGGGY